jgi:putative membrane protein
MDKIKEVRDVKETLEDSANAINKSLDVILNCMGSLSGSLNSTADGLASLEEARKVISEGKGQVYANLDQSLADLESIGNAMKPTEGDIKSAKETLAQVKKDLSSIHTTTKSLKDNITSTKKVLTGMKSDAKALRDLLDDLDDKVAPVNQKLNSLASSLDSLKVQLGNVDAVGDRAINSQLVEVAPGVKLSVGEINSIISSMNALYAEYQKQSPGGDFQAFATAILSAPPYSYDGPKIELFLGVWAKQEDIGKELAPVTSITNGLNDVASATASVVSQTSGVIKAMRQLDQELRLDYPALGDALLEDGENLSAEGIKVLEKLDAMIDQLDVLYSTLNAYEPNVQSALDHVDTLANTLTTGTINLKTLLSNTETLLKQSGAPLDVGTAKTLKGVIDSLRQATQGLNQTRVIQTAKNTVKSTIDDQWAEYTGENNNLLLIDTTSEKPSLTSSRNAAPETIQILMRTDEIILKNQEEKATVDETYVAKGTILSRIGDIFRDIGDAISGLFSS